LSSSCRELVDERKWIVVVVETQSKNSDNRHKEEDREFHDQAHPKIQFFLSEKYGAAEPTIMKLLKF
jgi:hypothetical protein